MRPPGSSLALRRRPSALCARRLTRTAAIVLAAGAVIAGCGTATSPLPADAPIATYAWDGDGGMQALLEGTLTLEDGCV